MDKKTSFVIYSGQNVTGVLFGSSSSAAHRTLYDSRKVLSSIQDSSW